MMNDRLKQYKKYIEAPWGRLFYRVVQTQIGDLSGLDILDFGSGFGVTASHYAVKNNLTAVEPNAEITAQIPSNCGYRLMMGDVNALKQFSDESFDYIFCHNVLEYADDCEREMIFAEFRRLLRQCGRISVIKHNPKGKVMQKVVCENDTEEAAEILKNGCSMSQNFGKISYYNIESLVEKCGMKIVKRFGLRTFWGLQNNDFKYDPDWLDRMTEMEMLTAEDKDFAAISFFNHLFIENLRRNDS